MNNLCNSRKNSQDAAGIFVVLEARNHEPLERMLLGCCWADISLGLRNQLRALLSKCGWMGAKDFDVSAHQI
jgi:hypothetical protein